MNVLRREHHRQRAAIALGDAEEGHEDAENEIVGDHRREASKVPAEVAEQQERNEGDSKSDEAKEGLRGGTLQHLEMFRV